MGSDLKGKSDEHRLGRDGSKSGIRGRCCHLCHGACPDVPAECVAPIITICTRKYETKNSGHKNWRGYSRRDRVRVLPAEHLDALQKTSVLGTRPKPDHIQLLPSAVIGGFGDCLQQRPPQTVKEILGSAPGRRLPAFAVCYPSVPIACRLFRRRRGCWLCSGGDEGGSGPRFAMRPGWHRRRLLQKESRLRFRQLFKLSAICRCSAGRMGLPAFQDPRLNPSRLLHLQPIRHSSLKEAQKWTDHDPTTLHSVDSFGMSQSSKRRT